MKYDNPDDFQVINLKDIPKFVDRLPLIVENGGNLVHMFYATDRLIHAFCDIATKECQWEIVDNEEGSGYQPAAAMDNRGKFHIIYISGDKLKYSTGETGSWKNFVIDKASNGYEGNYLYFYKDQLITSYFSQLSDSEKYVIVISNPIEFLENSYRRIFQ